MPISDGVEQPPELRATPLTPLPPKPHGSDTSYRTQSQVSGCGLTGPQTDGSPQADGRFSMHEIHMINILLPVVVACSPPSMIGAVTLSIVGAGIPPSAIGACRAGRAGGRLSRLGRGLSPRRRQTLKKVQRPDLVRRRHRGMDPRLGTGCGSIRIP
eukprot:scaffold3256_cov114-Isochrysis_galbana.AAC.8